MLLGVKEFCDQVQYNMNHFISELQKETGFTTASQALAWRNSFPKLSQVFSSSHLENFHLSISPSKIPGGVSVEYRLPLSSSRADIVLLGKDQKENPSVVIVELKDWDLSGVPKPGRSANLIPYQGTEILHPSDQVKGYVDYCRYFHSAVVEREVNIQGCVFFTNPNSDNIKNLESSPHDGLVKEFPLFSNDHLSQDFPLFLREFLFHPDERFAREFDGGHYVQSRSFVSAVAETIHKLRDNSSGRDFFYVLLDEQRAGFEKILGVINRSLQVSEDGEKIAVIVEGPPGSGKSALAVNLWAYLWENLVLPEKGKIAFVTTSSCQKANLQKLFDGFQKGAEGLIVPSNKFIGLSRAFYYQLVQTGKVEKGDYQSWERILRESWINGETPPNVPDDFFLVSIVDEAHSLIDPVKKSSRRKFSGWNPYAGPQAYHIIRGSRVSIFFMDPEQSFRDNENTSMQDIEKFGKMLGIQRVPHVSLLDAQYRCGGSKEYTQWVESLFRNSGQVSPNIWRRTKKNPQGPFVFEVLDSLFELEAKMVEHLKQGDSVRYASSYARKWKSKSTKNPYPSIDSCHGKPISGSTSKCQDCILDFCFEESGKKWCKAWNFVPGEKYDRFIQPDPSSQLSLPNGLPDFLKEVGCPYVVRGFDFDFLGILWLKDLFVRNGKWQLDFSQIHESAWDNSVADFRKAERENNRSSLEEAKQILLKKLFRGYRILLTRPIKGIYVWFEDPETREFVKKSLERG